MKMNDQWVIEHDLRGTVTHEWGHAVMADLCGGDAIIQILRNPNGGSDTKHWMGKCFLTVPVKPRFASQVALAGVVAETFAEGGTLDELLSYLLEDEDAASFSPTDRAMAGDWGERDVEIVWNKLRRYGRRRFLAERDEMVSHYLRLNREAA